MVGRLQHHIFYFHQPGLGAALVFIQLHGNIADVLSGLRDHHMLQGVDSAAGLLDLRRHQLTGLLTFRQLKKIRQKIRQLLNCVIQVP